MGSEHGQVLVLLTDVCSKNEITYLALHQLPETSDKHSKVYQLRTTVITRSTWLFIIFIIQVQALE